MLEFEESDDGLKWQWFTDVEAEFFFSQACGYYVAKVDVQAGQTEENQQIIALNEKKSILFENRQLALRMVAARKITQAMRKILDRM
jgi:hypothetical protein